MKRFLSKISLILSFAIIITSVQNFQSVFALNESEGLAPIYASESQTSNTEFYNPDVKIENLTSDYTPQSSSEQLTDGWVLRDSAWYFMSNGKPKSGWIYHDNKWYFCEENKGMKIGWLFDNGNWYFMQTNGSMQTGWIFINNNWYLLDTSGKMKTGWLLENENWYYLKSSGEMVRGWVLDGHWYYTDSSGKMLTKLHKIDSVWYFFKSNGQWSEDKSMTDIPGTFTDNNGNTIAYQKMMTGSCTAYTAPPGAITSIGLAPKVGYIAVDPAIIPYGTKMYICSDDGSVVYGYATAADTGGAMLSGKRLIDLYYNTENECIQFGVRTMNVYILS